MKRAKTKRIFALFIVDNNNQELVVGLKECVYPNRTKKYKSLQKRLQKNDVAEIGYKEVV